MYEDRDGRFFFAPVVAAAATVASGGSVSVGSMISLGAALLGLLALSNDTSCELPEICQLDEETSGYDELLDATFCRYWCPNNMEFVDEEWDGEVNCYPTTTYVPEMGI